MLITQKPGNNFFQHAKFSDEIAGYISIGDNFLPNDAFNDERVFRLSGRVNDYRNGRRYH